MHDETSTQGMRRLDGGRFQMGSDFHYPEEAPARPVHVPPFWIDEHPVTNARFSCFVAATGYVTQAERQWNAPTCVAAPPESAGPGSLVFRAPGGPVDLRDPSNWWIFCAGADWRHPAGPGSTLQGIEDHPVVHVTAADAGAYARWAGKTLPTEAEWEFAARGGLDGAEYAWGDQLAPDGALRANYWQGEFPWRNSLEDGFEGTSPVAAFPPNGFGLYDMIGNVWEWTADAYTDPGVLAGARACCASSAQAAAPRVIKGGSHLCAASYCRRYRPAARSAQAIDTSTGHIGFRCVRRGIG
jgi:formylglycine-generating enzyme